MLFALKAPHWYHHHAAKDGLQILQFAYPIVLLVFFLLAFGVRTIVTADPSDPNEAPTPKVQYGPGGKPLPVRSHSFKKVVQHDFSRSRKLVFEWLSVGVCLTLAANAAIVIVHALFDREEQWWCGQAPTVCFWRLSWYTAS